MTISVAAISTEALKFIGAPYVYGGTTPSGWDCSGFTQYVLKKVGYGNVPRTSEQQWAWVDKIDKSQLQPGDLVFAQFPGDNASPGHVGIYTGNGQVLSAEDPQSGTQESSLSSWGSNVVGYGRPPNSSQTASTTADVSGGLLSFPSQITDFFDQANTFTTSLMWLASPSSWVRIGAFIVGVGLLLFAIHALIAAGNGQPLVKTPSVIPVPV
jgi:cell wall-associated NlpC family hydrolase